MGYGRFSDDSVRASYDSRNVLRSNSAAALGISPTSATFDYDYKIKQGVIDARVHEKLKPFKVNRESRDSNGQAKTTIRPRV